MPLKKGRSKETIASNIRELIRSYQEKGTIGRTKPRSGRHAQKIAVAIAFNVARKGRRRRSALSRVIENA